MIPSKHFANFASSLKAKAEVMRNDAGYGGFHYDGGARELLEKVACWECGIAGVVPAVFAVYAKEYERSLDPEYQEYLRLQKKFK